MGLRKVYEHMLFFRLSTYSYDLTADLDEAAPHVGIGNQRSEWEDSQGRRIAQPRRYFPTTNKPPQVPAPGRLVSRRELRLAQQSTSAARARKEDDEQSNDTWSEWDGFSDDSGTNEPRVSVGRRKPGAAAPKTSVERPVTPPGASLRHLSDDSKDSGPDGPGERDESSDDDDFEPLDVGQEGSKSRVTTAPETARQRPGAAAGRTAAEAIELSSDHEESGSSGPEEAGNGSKGDKNGLQGDEKRPTTGDKESTLLLRNPAFDALLQICCAEQGKDLDPFQKHQREETRTEPGAPSSSTTDRTRKRAMRIPDSQDEGDDEPSDDAPPLKKRKL
ncbi:hypothetical protein [Rhizobium terrae]|uniref:hypothetical protein n=1 Tax=Rhizobium terrae TaxID=2171756 RepID=UPI0013C2D30D|nr:hypothetical protein [Rhizobium terrae]